MIARPAPARLQSLCGTARRMRIRNQQKLARNSNLIPCRPSGIWACMGLGERTRRMGFDPDLR